MYKSKELEMDIQELLFRQLDNFWKDYDKCTISKIIPDALYLMEKIILLCHLRDFIIMII